MYLRGIGRLGCLWVWSLGGLPGLSAAVRYLFFSQFLSIPMICAFGSPLKPLDAPRVRSRVIPHVSARVSAQEKVTPKILRLWHFYGPI